MSKISDIVNVTINIVDPQTTESAYNGMLLVIDAPSGGTATLPDVAEITKVSELTQYGIATTDNAYKACAVAFAQDPHPDKIYVTAQRTVEGTAEAISTTLDRATSTTGWYGFCVVTTSQTSLSDASTWAAANKKLLGICWTSGSAPSFLTTAAMTYGIYAGNHETVASGVTDYNPFANVAWMAKCFGYKPGSETWAFKTLASILPSTLTATEETTIKTAGGNIYTTVANKNITSDGKTGEGEWIDVIRFRDWLLAKIQSDVFAFFVANTKVPFTDGGISGVYNVLNAALKAGQDNGGIATTTFDSDGNEINGYTISVPKAKDVADSYKANRTLPNVTFTATLSGAIHNVVINGTLEY